MTGYRTIAQLGSGAWNRGIEGVWSKHLFAKLCAREGISGEKKREKYIEATFVTTFSGGQYHAQI
jgi:hypothetical protein